MKALWSPFALLLQIMRIFLQSTVHPLAFSMLLLCNQEIPGVPDGFVSALLPCLQPFVHGSRHICALNSAKTLWGIFLTLLLCSQPAACRLCTVSGKNGRQVWLYSLTRAPWGLTQQINPCIVKCLLSIHLVSSYPVWGGLVPPSAVPSRKRVVWSLSLLERADPFLEFNSLVIL